MKQHVIGFLIAAALFASSVAIERLQSVKPSLVAVPARPSDPYYDADLELQATEQYFERKHYRPYPVSVVGGTYAYPGAGVLRWTVRAFVAAPDASISQAADPVLVGQEVFESEGAAQRRIESLSSDPQAAPEGFGREALPTRQFRVGSCVYFLSIARIPGRQGSNDVLTDFEIYLAEKAGTQGRA